jgi:hypothetical protein
MGIVQALLQEPVQRQLELALHTFNRGLWARLGEIPLLFARKDPKAQRREFSIRSQVPAIAHLAILSISGQFNDKNLCVLASWRDPSSFRTQRCKGAKKRVQSTIPSSHFRNRITNRISEKSGSFAILSIPCGDVIQESIKHENSLFLSIELTDELTLRVPDGGTAGSNKIVAWPNTV